MGVISISNLKLLFFETETLPWREELKNITLFLQFVKQKSRTDSFSFSLPHTHRSQILILTQITIQKYFQSIIKL